MKIALPIKKGPLEAILRGEKEWEYREDSPFWGKRLTKIVKALQGGKVSIEDVVAILICGREVHHYRIRGILSASRDTVPEQWRSYIRTEWAWGMHLGERIQ